MSKLKIYLRTDARGGFSDFSNYSTRYPVEYGTHTFATAEHMFQALKFLGNETGKERLVMNVYDPLTEAHKWDDWKRADWFEVNTIVMKIVLYCKFTQYEILKEKLLATHPHELINNVADMFWGTGEKFEGSNQFGKVLMAVREELSKSSPPRIPPLPSLPKQIIYDSKFIDEDIGPIMHGGKKWKTIGHLFQAWKFSNNSSLVKMIHNAYSRNDAFIIAKYNGSAIREDWGEISVLVIRYIVYLAVKGRETLLLKTESAELLQKTTEDEFWGSGDGPNQLGKAFVRVRGIIKYKFEEPNEPKDPPYFEEEQPTIASSGHRGA